VLRYPRFSELITDWRLSCNLKAIVRLPLGTFAIWSGLTPDNEPLLSRDISIQEIYSLEWSSE
jgi:hypothetical protein